MKYLVQFEVDDKYNFALTQKKLKKFIEDELPDARQCETDAIILNYNHGNSDERLNVPLSTIGNKGHVPIFCT